MHCQALVWSSRADRSNAQGYGTGGVAGIYEVDNSTTPTSTNCIKQSIAPTGQWPVGLATNTLSPATLPVTERADPGADLSGGAIAGIVIGALAGLVILALALWFILRRRRRREAATQKIASHDVDLADETAMVRTRSTSTSHMIEPYRSLDPFDNQQQALDTGNTPRDDTGDGGTITSAGFAGLGAGVGAGLAGQRSRSSGDDARLSGPGVAGALPQKGSHTSQSPSTSSQPANQTLKNELLSGGTPGMETSIGTTTAPGAMRVVNHDNPASIPTLPPGARLDDRERERERERRRRDPLAGPTFRRHEDAGRIPDMRGREEEVVDLPPLYTDVPRDGPEPEYTPPGEGSSVRELR